MNEVKTNGDIAVVIPCYNEAVTIAAVVKDFQAALPGARIYVYDNNSDDDTAQAARTAGAQVRREPSKGKGNVVRRLFADIEAEVYLMVDGDCTYDAPSAPAMVRMLREGNLDMVVGCRRTASKEEEKKAYRFGHVAGNRLFNCVARCLLGGTMRDMLSGYRAFSRRFAKSFPVHSSGFGIETEISVHALKLRLLTAEIDTPYYARPENSRSKLNTWRDGVIVLFTMIRLCLLEQPFRSFTLIALALLIAASALFMSHFSAFPDEGLIMGSATLLLGLCAGLASLGSFITGLILHTLALGRRETALLSYLAFPGSDGEHAANDSGPGE